MLHESTTYLWGTSHHPDRGVYEPRHMIDNDQALSCVSTFRTLCGRVVTYAYDWSTPLLSTCATCERVERAGTKQPVLKRITA